MAKTESTAVNELISLVQNKQAPSDPPSVDLFSVPKSTRVNPPRVTTNMPTMRGAGEVAPLPRGRAPNSTSNLPVPPSVRMSTAEVSRGNTIPPIPAMRASQSMTLETPPRSQTQPPPHPAQSLVQPPPLPQTQPPPRPSQQTQPPPRPSQSATLQTQPPARPSQSVTEPTQRPSVPLPTRPSVPLPTQRGSQPPLRPTLRGTLPPPAQMAAAPASDDNPLVAVPVVPQQFPIVRPSSSVDMTGDVIKTDPWFELSVPHPKVAHPDESWVGTAPVVKQRRDTLALVKKLVAPTIVLAIVGVMVGGYFAFNGEGGKQKHAAKAPVAIAAKIEAANPASAPQPVEAPAQAEAAAPVEAPAKAEAAQEPAKPAVVPPPADDNSMLPAATAAALTHDAPKQPAAAATAMAAAPAPKAAAPAAAAPTTTASAPTKAAAPAAMAVAAPAPTRAAAPAPTKAAAPAPTAIASAPAPVQEIKTPQGVVKFVDVRIDSKPAGATVMLVDNGKTSFLGSTPIATSLDPSRSYDVIFTLSGRPTQMAHIDPTKSSKLEVALGKPVASAEHHHHHAKVDDAAKAEVKAEPAKVVAVAKLEPAKVEPAKVAAVAAPAKAEPAKAAAPTKLEKAVPATDDENPLAKGAKKAEPAKVAAPTKLEKAVPATDDENPLAKGAAKKAEPTKAAVAAKASEPAKKIEAPKPNEAARIDAPKAEPAKKLDAPKAEPAKTKAGTGTLMVSSKPPCEILIDGKATGLTTPQRSIPVPTGTHKVTFVNEAEGIKKTVSVAISPDQPTKLIQDLMKK